MNAFEGPQIKHENVKLNESLTEAKTQLENTKQICQNLEVKLCEKDTLFLVKEKNLQEVFQCELSKSEFEFESFLN